jgi:hypothetical protein
VVRYSAISRVASRNGTKYGLSTAASAHGFVDRAWTSARSPYRSWGPCVRRNRALFLFTIVLFFILPSPSFLFSIVLFFILLTSLLFLFICILLLPLLHFLPHLPYMLFLPFFPPFFSTLSCLSHLLPFILDFCMLLFLFFFPLPVLFPSSSFSFYHFLPVNLHFLPFCSPFP